MGCILGDSPLASLLETYAAVAGQDVIGQLGQLANQLKGLKIACVNSTRVGGGVAEILTKLIPLMQALGIDTTWEVISGDESFFQCTKSIHNGLQGNKLEIPQHLLEAYEETNRDNAKQLAPLLEEADIVFIHDPQPAPLLHFFPHRKGKWLWRCHIDLSRPHRPVWKYLRRFVEGYDASVYSLPQFSQRLAHPQYLVPPSIDPLSEKNRELQEEEIQGLCHHLGIDMNKPLMLQVSRFDRFKDPLGVIQAFRLAKQYIPDLHLVLAGGSATDDPEGALVHGEVEAFSRKDENIQVLALPPDAHKTINALQRAADIVLQKSIREGFGLTVTEAMWKGKAVVGGNTGGIRLQVIDNHTGFLVNTPEGAALRVRYLLERPHKLREMGEKARHFVRENYLITRQLREYLTVMVALIHGCQDRVELE